MNKELDPFCGCGTAIIASHKLNRRWIGIDINKFAYDTTKGREMQLPLLSQGYFSKAKYVSRDIDEVITMNPHDFEKWVNEFYKASKPMPDAGIDGITQDNIPIQTKTFLVNGKRVRNLFGDAKLHPQVQKPCNHVIMVSQIGFDDSARQEQFKIQTQENVMVELLTPPIMLKQDKPNSL